MAHPSVCSPRPRLLDLFCGAGGAAMGYHHAGFDVVGVDIVAQPRYPFAFVQADALGYLSAHGREFDAIHASPPCQAYSNARHIRAREHPRMINGIRNALIELAKPYTIENVVGAGLINPIVLCGASFPALRVYRHREFEASFSLPELFHVDHAWPQRKMGRPPSSGEFMHVVGNFSGVIQARKAMDIGWMTRNELSEAIPPAYTEYVGRHLIAAL